MAKYTPGPWKISTIDGRTIGPFYDEPQFGGGAITRQKAVAVAKERIGETEANARLIAAAPDLLAALQAVLRSAGYESGAAEPTLRELRVALTALDAARAAVARAEGKD